MKTSRDTRNLLNCPQDLMYRPARPDQVFVSPSNDRCRYRPWLDPTGGRWTTSLCFPDKVVTFIRNWRKALAMKQGTGPLQTAHLSPEVLSVQGEEELILILNNWTHTLHVDNGRTIFSEFNLLKFYTIFLLSIVFCELVVLRNVTTSQFRLGILSLVFYLLYFPPNWWSV